MQTQSGLSRVRSAAAAQGFWRWLLLALGACILIPHAAVIYDGIGFPDEPYRYVHAPAGAKATQPPTSVQGGIPVKGGVSTLGDVYATKESGPQASVYLTRGNVTVNDPASTRVAMDLTPLAGEPPAEGNIYRLTLSSDRGVAALHPVAGEDVILLRAPAARPGIRMRYRESAQSPWRDIETSRSGQDVYAANLQGVGEYELAGTASAPRSGQPGPAGAGGGSHIIIYVLGTTLAVCTIAILLVRRRGGLSS